MSAPDFSRGFLRVTTGLWRALFCHAPVTRRQLQLLSVVLRESWGWQQAGRVRLWTRPLSTRQFAALTGLSTDRIRADLDVLEARGLLRRDHDRYQLIADPALWKTLGPRAPKARRKTPKRRPIPAVSALPALVSKKEKERETNVPLPTWRQLSPAVDNCRSGELARRLVSVIEAFAGPLPLTLRQEVLGWTQRTSIAEVWGTLQPVLLECSHVHARRALLAILTERSPADGTARGEERSG